MNLSGRMKAAVGALALAMPASGALAQESQIQLHDRVCVKTGAQPTAVAPLVTSDDWRPMFAGPETDLVSRVSAADPLDVVMARIVVQGDISEAVCSIQRRGADYAQMKAEFEAATGLTPDPRNSSRTVSLYIARTADGRLSSVERPNLNAARRDPDSRIFSLSRMGDGALIVVSFPQR